VPRLGFAIVPPALKSSDMSALVRGRIWRVALVSAVAGLVLASCSHPSPPPGPNPPTAFATSTSEAAAGRPNIVFVLTDDLSDNLVSQMPAVLAMEQHGASFSHYDVVDSLCCPSRSAIFTGEYPHDDGVFTNRPPFGGYQAYVAHHDERHAFAVSLKGLGYTTAFMGKYLNGYPANGPVPPGWDVWDGVNAGGYQEYNYRVNVNGVPVQYGNAPGDYLTDVLSQKATSFISSASTSSHPFFLEVATFAPHAPFIPAPKYAHAADGALYPATPAYDAAVTNPPPWLGQRPPLTTTEELRMSSDYRRRVEVDYSVDDLINNITSALASAGVQNNTYIVFSSDNGFHMGEYRLLDGKQTAFDTDINVPLVITGPQVADGRAVSGLASNIDLAPTFDAMAHAPVDPKTDGVSLLPLLSGHTPPDWQRAVLIEHHGTNDAPGDPDAQSQAQADPPSYEAIRTADALFVRYVGGFEEYYNTDLDPYELDNLGGSRAPPYLKRALRALSQCHRAVECQKAATAPFTPPRD
jgi:N-acetylglucosamine-6-sulfatase